MSDSMVSSPSPPSDDAQPSLPRVYLKRGLEGQDENLDGLMGMYEDLQLNSVEAARENDFLAFVENALYFAVIHKTPGVFPIASDDFNYPTFEEFKKKSRRSRRPASADTKPSLGPSSPGSEVVDDSYIGQAAGNATPSFVHDEETPQLWDAPAVRTDISPPSLTYVDQNPNDPVGYDMDVVRRSSPLDDHRNIPPFDCQEEPVSTSDTLPPLDEYLNARYDIPKGSTGTGTRLDFAIATRFPIGWPRKPPVSPLPPVANVHPYIGFVYLTRTQPKTEVLDASGMVGELNIGIILRKADRGKGYARAAVKKVLKDLFDKRNDCHRVQALVPQSREKERVINLFTQLQFGHEGTRRRSFFSFGEWKDTTCLAILNTDWTMRSFFSPAPRTLWDEMFIRHERERDELLRWEERKMIGKVLLQRSASMETVKDHPKDREVSSSSLSSSTSGHNDKGKDGVPRRTPTPTSQSESESESEGDMLYMRDKGKRRAAAVTSLFGLNHPSDAKGSFNNPGNAYRDAYKPLSSGEEEEKAYQSTFTRSASRSSSVSSSLGSGYSSSSASVVSRPPPSSVSGSGSDWEMMDEDDYDYYDVRSEDEDEDVDSGEDA